MLIALSQSLFDPRHRARWAVLCLSLLCVISWLAFRDSDGGAGFAHFDKLKHLAAFAVLSIIGCAAASPSRRTGWWIAAALLAYGGFIELVQTQLPHREAEWGDMLADAMGIGFGLLVVAMLRRVALQQR